MAIPTPYLRAAQKYGGMVDDIAARYRNPVTGRPLSGTALLLKLAKGESGFRMDVTSSAGAKGGTQFMPGSRAIAIKKFGVDPSKNVDQAIKAAALHLQGKINGSKGLEGYNPGMPSYPSYILGQRVGSVGTAGKARGGGGSNGGAGGASAGSPGVAGDPGTAGTPGDYGPQGSALALVQALQQANKPAPGGSPLPLPAFAAAPVLPSGTLMPQSAGAGPGAKPDISSLMGLVATTGGMNAQASAGVPATAPVAGSAPSAGGLAGGRAVTGGRGGTVKIAPGANRPGVDLSPGILKVARMVAGVHGAPLTVGTGSDHSKFSKSGNVSDHWGGNGVDIPASGAKLTDMGRDALVALGVDAKKAAQMAKQGGIFNIPYGKRRRVQVIVNTDGHFDHLHLGVTPK